MITYGLIGRTLSHSFSKKYFTQKFINENINAEYFNFECQSINDIKQLINKTNVLGFNITAPYKEQIIDIIDDVEEDAKSINAVNTIKKIDGKWIGYNTDVFGFKQMIKPFFKTNHQRAIVFGTGGASKAVQKVLEGIGADVFFISRTPKESNQFGYDDVNELMLKSCHILVNTTPIGTYPNIDECIQLPYQFLTPNHLCIDLVYNPKESLFLKKSKENNAVILNGLTMLHQQAEKAWKIWTSALNNDG